MLRSAHVLIPALLIVALSAYGQNPPNQQDRQNQGNSQNQENSQGKQEDKTAPAANAPIDPAKAVAAPVDPKTFQIGAEDVIYIQVWHDNDWTRSHMVRPDGKITLPLIGDIQAAGLTPEELAQNVAKVLSKYINNPEVNVTVLQVNSKKFYVTGEVNKPGSYPLVTPTRVLEALTNAGGFRDFANLKKITILRHGKTIKFNYKEVTHGKHLEQNIYLENGDYIVVP